MSAFASLTATEYWKHSDATLAAKSCFRIVRRSKRLIPRAIDWFTGEAPQFEELDDDMEEGDDDEDDAMFRECNDEP